MHSGFGGIRKLGILAIWLLPLMTLGLIISAILWIVRTISGALETE